MTVCAAASDQLATTSTSSVKRNMAGGRTDGNAPQSISKWRVRAKSTKSKSQLWRFSLPRFDDERSDQMYGTVRIQRSRTHTKIECMRWRGPEHLWIQTGVTMSAVVRPPRFPLRFAPKGDQANWQRNWPTGRVQMAGQPGACQLLGEQGHAQWPRG
jgi:hypothetical protein